jgi:hypothetical protein
MEADVESGSSKDQQASNPRSSNWLRIAFFTAGSALAGGLAAAWWYRKTLTKLRETGEMSQNPQVPSLGGQDADRSEEDV